MRHTCRFKLTFQHGFRDPNQADKREIVTRRPKAFDLLLMLREKQPWLHLALPRLPACVPAPRQTGGVGSSQGKALIRLDCRRQQLKAVVLSETLSHGLAPLPTEWIILEQQLAPRARANKIYNSKMGQGAEEERSKHFDLFL